MGDCIISNPIFLHSTYLVIFSSCISPSSWVAQPPDQMALHPPAWLGTAQLLDQEAQRSIRYLPNVLQSLWCHSPTRKRNIRVPGRNPNRNASQVWGTHRTQMEQGHCGELGIWKELLRTWVSAYSLKNSLFEQECMKKCYYHW